MKRYTSLFYEKMPLSIARKYVKDWNKKRLNDWFDNKYRIYLPLENPEPAINDLKSDIEKEIDRALENTQFRVKDFQSGIATDTKNNRDIKLGKVLQKIDKQLLQLFSASETRTGSKIKQSLVVISRHPYDIAGQSFDRGWTSCKNLSGGSNAKYVADEVNSALIAYLIYEDDKNINTPIARILINQFFNNKGDVAYIPQIRTYGSAGIWEKSFVFTVKEWLKSVQGNPVGTYKMNPFEYADSLSTTMKLIDTSKLPHWVYPNIPTDFEYKDEVFVWNIGDWNDGVWENGIWKRGIWHSGVWKNGTWEIGRWKTGTWENGYWEGGTWHNGTWKNGTWKNGIWKDGDWYDGRWNNGDWYNGEWYNGAWVDGTWYNGEWVDGVWNNGTWKEGMWYTGEWYHGTWVKGTWAEGYWYNGTWENGTWKNGYWDGGDWKGGTWEDGWIRDLDKKGNFEKDWDWDGLYVRSPINPKEYFAQK